MTGTNLTHTGHAYQPEPFSPCLADALSHAEVSRNALRRGVQTERPVGDFGAIVVRAATPCCVDSLPLLLIAPGLWKVFDGELQGPEQLEVACLGHFTRDDLPRVSAVCAADLQPS